MKYALAFSLISLLSSNLVHAREMQTLNDIELGNVSGQEGISLSIDYYLNTIKTSDPSTTGQVDTTFCPGTLDDISCRFTWQIANRAEGDNHSGLVGAKGEWLAYKDGFLSLTIDKLSLDASFLGDAGSASAAYSGWFNPETFQDSSGACLLAGGDGVSACTVAFIQSMPALRTHYPGTSGSYNSASHDTNGYNDVRLGMQIGGLSIEYNQAGTPGYLLNNHGSFAGLTIADNNGNQSGFAFGGNFYLYGF